MLYLSTCVGFGYGLMRGLFPGTASPPLQSDKEKRVTRSVTTRWLTNINVIPIDYAFRPRLRDRLTLRRLTLRRNPWTFGDTVFHSVCRYSCQHSHFRTLQDASRLSLHRNRNAPLPFRCQMTGVRYQKKARSASSASMQAHSTSGRSPILVRHISPRPSRRNIQDLLHSDTTTMFHPPIPNAMRNSVEILHDRFLLLRPYPSAIFAQIDLLRPPQLTSKPECCSFFGNDKDCPMNLQRRSICLLEDIHIPHRRGR